MGNLLSEIESFSGRFTVLIKIITLSDMKNYSNVYLSLTETNKFLVEKVQWIEKIKKLYKVCINYVENELIPSVDSIRNLQKKYTPLYPSTLETDVPVVVSNILTIPLELHYKKRKKDNKEENLDYSG
ncbi:hypothetical protein AVL50_05160 [Flammeovirga sp. SJP92]|nr:hypothetical protein AVL50_05160 [Flammeovirga sp. SJP92]